VLHHRRERDYQPDSIGVLTRPVDIVAWEASVRTRFQFLAELDDDERRWAVDVPYVEVSVVAADFRKEYVDDLLTAFEDLQVPLQWTIADR